MRFTICFTGLLGVFLAPAFANYNIDVIGDNNSSGGGQQSVSVNNNHNLANIDNDNGWDSWNSVWDYGAGYAATRSFAKKLCIVHKMNMQVMPSIETLDALVKENKLQGKGPEGPPPNSLVFSVNSNQVNDPSVFGKSIVSMCKGIPTYMAEEIEGSSLFYNAEKCFNANILWILGVSFCGEVEN
ncbi:gastrokine-1-like [Tamandua tetradactyla]|uniref:gastrokine-1-like n=1 Tax=Tamandua tetradactyla TaxID=48850 RepID=UPI004053D19A